jgi:hypothetical protein
MAEYKDYTNIAGTPFQPYVTQQIEKRKELIKKENRSSSDLQWLTNKNVWIRISSGADVDNDNPDFDDLGEVKGQKLARKYILQGGLFKDTSSDNQDNRELRAGIGPDGAYGIGGNDFGYRPMPGLTNISIKTGGKLGTLREATFEFTCYNKKQLDIMSALYMRLGFSVLVEWGHIPYINNTGQLENKPKPLPFFKSANQAGINDKEELMEQIQKNRVYHSGNYDALWGTIKNFTYSLEDNGTFKCQVQLVGAGDILESLKINQSAFTKDGKNTPTGSNTESNIIYATIADKNKSLLNEALYNYYQIITEKDIDDVNINNGVEFLTLVESYLKPNLGISFNLNGTEYNWKKNNELQRKGYHFSLISKLNTPQGNGSIQSTKIPDIENANYYFSRVIAGYKIDDNKIGNSIKEPGLEQAYITLGHLLLLIKATGFIYDKKDDKKEPYIYIDVNPETNRCYTFPGHCSLDPTVCLIGSQELPYKIKSAAFDKIKERYPFYDRISPELGGRFMHTLVNIEFITSTLRKYSRSNKENNVYFVDFLKDILDGISRACGGFNEFRIVPDDDTRCVRIFDDRVSSTYNYETAKYLTIPVLGKESIVYGFSYSSKISPQTAAQIVIAAQAQDGGVKTNKDALSFSHLNEGLTNRLSPSRVESVTDLNKTSNNQTSNQIELRTHLEGVYLGVGESIITQEDLENLENNLNINPEGIRDFEEVPNNLESVKNLLISQLETIFTDLQKSANNIKPNSSELLVLGNSRNDLIIFINNLTEIPKDISNGISIKTDDPNDPTFTSTKESRRKYLINKLSNIYRPNSPNNFDSEIEKNWQKLFGEDF